MSPGSDSDESAKPIVPSGARRTDELGNDPSDESAKLIVPSGARRVDELGEGPSDDSKKPVVPSGARRADELGEGQLEEGPSDDSKKPVIPSGTRRVDELGDGGQPGRHQPATNATMAIRAVAAQRLFLLFDFSRNKVQGVVPSEVRGTGITRDDILCNNCL